MRRSAFTLVLVAALALTLAFFLLPIAAVFLRVSPGTLLDQLGRDVVVDAVGRMLPDAIEVSAQSGRIVLFGMNENARPPIHQVDITRKGLTIFGSYITDFTFPPATSFGVTSTPRTRCSANSDR